MVNSQHDSVELELSLRGPRDRGGGRVGLGTTANMSLRQRHSLPTCRVRGAGQGEGGRGYKVSILHVSSMPLLSMTIKRQEIVEKEAIRGKKKRKESREDVR